MIEKEEHIKYLIQRFDNLISDVNTKSSFMLAFNTFLIGGIFIFYSDLKETFEMTATCSIAFNGLCVILFIMALLATYFIMKAVFPFLDSGNSKDNTYKSLVFFNSIQELETPSAFYTAINQQNEEERQKDLACQAYQLTKGLNMKFIFVNKAMKLIYIELFIIFLLLTILILSGYEIV